MRARIGIAGWARLASIALFVAAALTSQASAQSPREAPPFFDLARKPERVELTGQRVIRFITDDDYPPFHFPGPDGQLTGFNVDLARALCQELKAACTIQARRWDTHFATLEEGRADAAIASHNGQGAPRGRIEFGIPYYRTPARFVVRKAVIGLAGVAAPTIPQGLAGKTVGIVAGSTHGAFLTAFFPQIIRREFIDFDELQAALSSGKVEIGFGDGISLAVWLNSQNCCTFLGGAFYESRYFGEGASIAFRRDNPQLRRAVDHALYRLAENGTYTNLLLKYFPVSFY